MAKKSLVRISIFTVILLAIFLPPFVKYQLLSWRGWELENKIKQLKEETKRLEAEKLRLQTDITYVEKRAREKMGVVKKGEIVFKGAPAKK
jgi:cell division protein FtsB